MTAKLMVELGLTIGLLVLYFITFSSKKRAAIDKGYYAFYSLMLIVLVVAVQLVFVYL